MESDAEDFYDCHDYQGPPSCSTGLPRVQREGRAVGRWKCKETPGRSLDGEDPEYHTGSGRCRLPCPMEPRNDFGIWSILKQCIGKELSKITMPITFNEPLSFLQRVAEYMEYSELLQEASDSQDPVERHELVTAFAVSACASNWERIGKPFNPLLGETYELTREDLSFRMVCEQVSHHPPITAFHVDSPIFAFHGSIHPKLKFWGKSVEVTPKGIVTLYLKRHCEAYSWQFVNCCIHNIIVGKLWIEHYGVMEVTNHRSNWKSVLNFRPCGWFGKDLHKIMGHLLDRKQKLRVFYGKWTNAFYSYGVDVWDDYQHLVANHPDSQLKAAPGKDDRFNIVEPKSMFFGLTKAISEPSMLSSNDFPTEHPLNDSFCDLNLPGQKVLWKVNPKPKDHQRYYGFTLFAMNLNALDDEMKEHLPPTDCRFRPDIRLLEDGLIDAAAAEKERLEEKQRAARKDENRQKNGHQPTWFVWERNPHTGMEDWLIRGDYWKREWQTCPDIY